MRFSKAFMTDLLCVVMCLKLSEVTASIPSNLAVKRTQTLESVPSSIWHINIISNFKKVIDLLNALHAFLARLPQTIFLSLNWDNLSSCTYMPTHSLAVSFFPDSFFTYKKRLICTHEVNVLESNQSVRLLLIKCVISVSNWSHKAL